MQCPHCEYQEHASVEPDDVTPAPHGLFFWSPVKLERDDAGQYWKNKEARLCGCPRCKSTFIVEVDR